MAIQTRTTLKGYFNAGDEPTETHFSDLIESSAEVNFVYQTEASDDVDYSSTISGSTNIIINGAMASGKDIRLPEATTSNGGMVIKLLWLLAPAAQCNIGFVTTKIVGGASVIGAATEGNAPTDLAMVSSAVGTANLRIEIDVDAAAKAGGHPGSVMEFIYTGVANTVFYRGYLHADVDDATLATHFTTTAITS